VKKGGSAVTLVSESTLAQGVWYALENCGSLLVDAVERFNNGRLSTALALSLVAAEEFGKSRGLLSLWDLKAEKSRGVITAEEVREIVRPKKKSHEKKQALALVGITSGLAIGTEIGDIMVELSKFLVDLRENKIRRGEPAESLLDDLLMHPLVPSLVSAMAKARERVLYVDLRADGTGWERPFDAFGPLMKELVSMVLSQVYGNYTSVCLNLKPENLRLHSLNSRPNLANALESWSVRPELPKLPLQKAHWE